MSVNLCKLSSESCLQESDEENSEALGEEIPNS